MENCLILKGKGKNASQSSLLVVTPVNHSYQVEVEMEVSGDASGGLILFYNPDLFCGIGISPGGYAI